jgi:hypothetical protein
MNQPTKFYFYLFISFKVLIFSSSAQAQWYTQVEGASIWQSQNDQAVPGDGGTRFALTDFGKGPFFAYRIYIGQRVNERHEWRALYAPFRLNLSGSFEEDVLFQGQNFLEGSKTEAVYQFNSYRLTYGYHLDVVSDWKWVVGFTGKIRDAEVKLSQGSLSARKTNVGFVPLLHLRGERSLSDQWLFRFDLDGLAAPQGRAFDLAAFFERKLDDKGLSAFLGYRTVEGGADNEAVYNFAWIHYLTLGFHQEF